MPSSPPGHSSPQSTPTGATATAPPEPERRPRRHLVGKLLLALTGLAVGLAAAEVVFRFRDDAGFPKLNLYIADSALGVRLLPGGSQRLVYAGNPRTSIRINAQGYRGADLPTADAAAPSADVLIVGDSQVFGLGVEEGETFSAVLQQKLGVGRRVLNGGVPTYGPDEYAAVVRELVEQRKANPPKTVVFTINMVNDLFEASRPNRDRHAVSDGWAVRKDVAPSITDFPGRSFLARHSHLFYAVRSLWHRDTDGQSAASEGTWKDLVASGARTAEHRAEAQQKRKERASERRKTEAELMQSTEAIDDGIIRLLFEQLSDEERATLEAAHRQPGQYVSVYEPGLEEGRTVVVTAEHIRRGAALRAKLRAKVAALAAKERGPLKERLLAGLSSEPKAAARLEELGLANFSAALQTPVAPAIRELKKFCDERGVRLVLLILPIDVSVSASEWKKYGAEPLDMSGTAALHEEILALGAELGVSALDATAALRAAQPGAFLDHDIHMTPRGHAAVAAALRDTLAAPPPAPPVVLSSLPVPAQWNAVREINVAGSTAAGCETKRIREWVRILCIPRDYGDLASVPQKIEVGEHRARRVMTMVMPASAALTVAMAPGDSLTATFTWKHATRKLEMSWAKDAASPTAAFQVLREERPDEPSYQRPEFPTELARSLCQCWQEIYLPDDRSPPKFPLCPAIYGDLIPGCYRYAGTCADMVACALGDPGSLPGPASEGAASLAPPTASLEKPPAIPLGVAREQLRQRQAR